MAHSLPSRVASCLSILNPIVIVITEGKVCCIKGVYWIANLTHWFLQQTKVCEHPPRPCPTIYYIFSFKKNTFFTSRGQLEYRWPPCMCVCLPYCRSGPSRVSRSYGPNRSTPVRKRRPRELREVGRTSRMPLSQSGTTSHGGHRHSVSVVRWCAAGLLLCCEVCVLPHHSYKT